MWEQRVKLLLLLGTKTWSLVSCGLLIEMLHVGYWAFRVPAADSRPWLGSRDTLSFCLSCHHSHCLVTTASDCVVLTMNVELGYFSSQHVVKIPFYPVSALYHYLTCILDTMCLSFLQVIHSHKCSYDHSSFILDTFGGWIQCTNPLSNKQSWHLSETTCEISSRVQRKLCMMNTRLLEHCSPPPCYFYFFPLSDPATSQECRPVTPATWEG